MAVIAALADAKFWLTELKLAVTESESEESALGSKSETFVTMLLEFMKATIGPEVNIEAKVPVGVMLPAAIAENKEAAEEAEANAELIEANSELKLVVLDESVAVELDDDESFEAFEEVPVEDEAVPVDDEAAPVDEAVPVDDESLEDAPVEAEVIDESVTLVALALVVELAFELAPDSLATLALDALATLAELALAALALILATMLLKLACALALLKLALTLPNAEAKSPLAAVPLPATIAEVILAIFSIMEVSVAVARKAEASDNWEAKEGLVAVKTYADMEASFELKEAAETEALTAAMTELIEAS